jgi:multiple sugar transport system substrate-binding protein
VLRRDALRALALGPLASAAACRRRSTRARAQDGRPRLVFEHQPMWGDPAPLHALFDAFARAHPDVELVTSLLPSASESLHQHYLTTLEGGAAPFDVFVMDVVWGPEFARAGWLADLSEAFPVASIRRDFVPAAVESVDVGGRTIAVPWYLDVGLLYRRTDLVPSAPRTPDELADAVERTRGRVEHGYLFQGRQYEGLVCCAFEAMWAFGAETMRNGRVVVDSPEARAGMRWLRELVARGIAPRSTTSAAEEDTRRVFQAGRAAMMRNWPYAFAELQTMESSVRGEVAISAMPSLDTALGHGALGGWQLGVAASTEGRVREAAIALVAHLTSPEAALVLARAYARAPARRATYIDPSLQQDAPFLAALGPIVDAARPRPPTPYYVMISDVLQTEFSAIVAGVRPADVALSRAQSLIDHVTESA